MQLDAPAFIHFAGILAVIGALLYAVSDVLLLGYEAGPREAPPAATEADLEPYAMTPFSASDLLNLAVLPASRLAWGGLLGVLATPLLMVGLWPLFNALRPAGLWWALAPTLLLAYTMILAPFVHGSFIYIEQNAQALVHLAAEARPVLGATFRLQQKVLSTSYVILLIALILSALLYSIVVILFDTLLPRWMAAVNPVTMTLAFLLLKRVFPQQLTRYVEGAGFNIAFFLFFALLTVTMW
jgi:hypothetical protein